MTDTIVGYDLETVNNYDFKVLNQQVKDNLITHNQKLEIIAQQSIPLEIGLLYVDSLSNPQTKVCCKIKFSFNKPLWKCSKEQIECLLFYFKHQLQREIDIKELPLLIQEHNLESKSLSTIGHYLYKFLQKYVKLDIIKDKLHPFMLFGKNNHQFDDLILQNLLKKFFPHRIKEIFYQSFDLQEFIFKMRKSSLISVEDKLKYFTFSPDKQGHKYTLSNISFNLFHKKISNAHDSLGDIKATYQIFRHYYDCGFIQAFSYSSSLSHSELNTQFGTLPKRYAEQK